MVIHGRRGQRTVILMDDLLRLSMFEQFAPGQPEADAAYAAFVACGKGNGHPAGLDFGDLFRSVQLCAGQDPGSATALQG